MNTNLSKAEKALLERREKLAKKLAQADAQIAAREARRKQAERKKKRADEAQRVKILGTWLLENERWKKHIQELNVYLERPADRKLLGLTGDRKTATEEKKEKIWVDHIPEKKSKRTTAKPPPPPTRVF